MDKRLGPVSLYARPELRRPYMVAAWSGMGAVALLAVNYLRQELGAALLGEVDPYRFFSPSQVPIENGIVQRPELPETKFYSWDEGDTHDLVILVGTEQPSDMREMSECVVDVAQQFGVERIYTTAATPSLIHHSREPGVWGLATHPHLVAALGAYGVRVMNEGTIGGLNGLLLATAKERDIEGICLLGEIPLYASQMINPRASHAVLTVLSAMLDLEVDLERLLRWAEDLRPEMDNLYDILPEHVREAIEHGQERAPLPRSEPAQAEQPLVADARFFDEIERFLEQRSEAENGEDGDQDEQHPRPGEET